MLKKEQQQNKRSGSIEGGITILRMSGNIKEEWQHPRRQGDKIKDFRVRLTCCIATDAKHQRVIYKRTKLWQLK